MLYKSGTLCYNKLKRKTLIQRRNEMSFVNNGFEKYSLFTAELENDGYIGIPVTLTVLFDKENFTVSSGFTGTPIMVYVINTMASRVGTLSDAQIVSGMLERGYVVTVLDYKENEAAVCPFLDYSVQGIRRRIMNGEFFEGIACMGKGYYPETLVIPSGHDVLFGEVYWEYDRHCTDGTLEKIVEIWNNDFRGTKGEFLVKWIDKRGQRKFTQNGHDGSEPIWYDKDGNESEHGEYVKVKHTLVKDVTDCAKPDGTMIDFKLYMHVVYPTEPKEKVPVMCLASSSEDICVCSATADRPHMNGFVFNGYAGVMYDYGYVPMARNDHYGYFDGYPKAGYITGDNVTYSLKAYNFGIDRAAMRYIRYLALSQGDKFRFDINAIGVYGNSKAGAVTYLGEAEPENVPSQRFFKGHHDETRFENGDTEDREGVKGGEQQPWLTYNGEPISSRANLVYSSCGGAPHTITKGYSPLFIVSNRRDGGCFSVANTIANIARSYGMPAMWFEIPLGHTITYGKDLHFGIDTYKAFFDCAGYYLKGDAVKALGVRENKYMFPASVTVMFTGPISESEAAKIKVTDKNGDLVGGTLTCEFGGCEWTFTPSEPCYGSGYVIEVPETVVGQNGKPIQKGFEKTFELCKGELAELSSAVTEYAKRSIAFEVVNDGVNTVSAFTGDGKYIGSVNTSGKGWYKINVVESDVKLSDVTLRVDKKSASASVCAPFTLCEVAEGCENVAFDGKKAIRVDSLKLITRFPTQEYYRDPRPVVKCDSIIKEDALDDSDIGRRFKISFKVYDTVSRYIQFSLNNCTNKAENLVDYRYYIGNERTRKGEWTEYSFDYTVYEPIYGDYGKQKKVFTVSAIGNGDRVCPIYFADPKCEEIVTEVELGRIRAVYEADEKHLPLGKGM